MQSLELNATLCNQIFGQALNDYRSSESQSTTPSKSDQLESILYLKNWIDNTQWDAEDQIRDPKAPIADIVKLKRKIDGLNQERTDLIEQLDDYIFSQLNHVTPRTDARINTETPAWAIDRLSILHIKIYQMKKEAHRASASDDHRSVCAEKLSILQFQYEDLSKAIDQLLYEMINGTCQVKTYKQMKMYNDPELNPVLRANP